MNRTDNIKQQLLKTGSLLELTRQNPSGIAQTIKFTLNDQCQLSLLDTGILLVEPQQACNKDLVISSAIHGNETAPIEIVDQLVREILQQQLKVRNRCLFIIGNPIAMNKGKRFDIENMNRLFNGNHLGKEHYEAKRVGLLEDAVKNFFIDDNKQRYHYDLHTAIRGSKYKKFAIYPYRDGKPWDKSQLQFFLASHINTILLNHQPSGTFSYYSSHNFAANAFTVELGKVKPFGENDMEEFVGICDNLRRLIKAEDIPTTPFDNNDFNIFQVLSELIKHSETEFTLNIAKNVENFTDFPKGTQLSNDIDGGYITQQPGEAIIFPNPDVPVGQRAGIIVGKTEI